jgi:DNA polymerase III subunit epsilon
VRIVAIDLEGTGSAPGAAEAILEIALVPLADDLKPDMKHTFSTLLNPGRPIPKRPWISPGITDAAVQHAPSLDQVTDDIATRIDGAYLLGHNVRVDWSLLSRDFPDLRPLGLLDTLRLARAHRGKNGNSLTALIDHYDLEADTAALVPHGQPHRALWDAVACALLLSSLKADMKIGSPDQLVAAAAITTARTGTLAAKPEQPTLFG